MKNTENIFEIEAKSLLKKHGCTFISMLGECEVLWKNKNDKVRRDDKFILRTMTEKAWEFWSNY